eukprot:SAG31_NODE_4257_length_3414_cov_1.764706_2_plen_261_part_00
MEQLLSSTGEPNLDLLTGETSLCPPRLLNTTDQNRSRRDKHAGNDNQDAKAALSRSCAPATAEIPAGDRSQSARERRTAAEELQGWSSTLRPASNSRHRRTGSPSSSSANHQRRHLRPRSAPRGHHHGGEAGAPTRRAGGAPNSSRPTPSSVADAIHKAKPSLDTSAAAGQGHSGQRAARSLQPASALRQSKCKAVDQLVTELTTRFRAEGCPLPLKRHSDFVYKLGNRKVSLSVISGKLVVRAGAGYVDFLNFLEKARF